MAWARASGVVGRDDDSALVSRHNWSAPTLSVVMTGRPRMSASTTLRENGVEEGGDDDDAGQPDLANDLEGADPAEVFHPRAVELDAHDFLGFLPAPDEAPVVFGEIADDDKGRDSFRGFGLRKRP